MSSLYRRANLRQRRILRIIEGACKNAAHAHEYELPDHFARSVAKRAAGTLTAQWPEVLAGPLAEPPDRADEQVILRQPRASHRPSNWRGRGASQLYGRRSPLPTLWRRIAAQVGPLKRAGQIERAETLIDVLRMIAAMQKPKG